jgi:hypothetical protein
MKTKYLSTKNKKMKKKLFFLSILMMGVLSVHVHAQSLKMPSVSDVTGSLDLPEDKAGFEKDFLKALDPGKDLGLSTDMLGKLATGNKGLVSDVMGIMGGKGSDNDKLTKILARNTDWTKLVTNLLGNDKAKKYLDLVKNQMGPFKKKYNLAKMFM